MTATIRFAPGTFRPNPQPGAPLRMLAAQAGTELRLHLRHGEQVLLTLLIPIALLVGLALLPILPLPEPRLDVIAPRIIALAVMSSAFTGQAIALGFDRRYGVVKRLAATGVPRWMLLAGRILAVLGVVAVQLVLITVVAVALGWRPALPGLLPALLLVILGALTFAALGVLLGGALRADIVLALANIIWFALLLGGGVALPTAQLPGAWADIAAYLPTAALADGLHTVTATGSWPGAHPILVLLGWGAAATALACRTTKLS
ncbi:ABC transporter permease [Crossiella cryophila]|uniref:ABC-2 type transport system permease protein n=1 Tax=Crossiella cryophila TaxID=43355 RepID=A0A7W7CAU2_9PSEU|nr:ABC transporter permease [Crossiella cryophila]MBB4677729.1 ABC-2 type transport system permease protein [Crossiella cryophila]